MTDENTPLTPEEKEELIDDIIEDAATIEREEAVELFKGGHEQIHGDNEE